MTKRIHLRSDVGRHLPIQVYFYGRYAFKILIDSRRHCPVVHSFLDTYQPLKSIALSISQPITDPFTGLVFELVVSDQNQFTVQIYSLGREQCLPANNS